MDWTDEERADWLVAKRVREAEPKATRSPAVAICVNCQNSFGRGEGHIGEEVAMCDSCIGD